MAAWERDAVEALINIYEESRCLYEVSSPDYHNKQKRTLALQEIAKNLAPFRSSTTAEDVKSKINGLRTQYMAEKNKLKKSQKSGTSVDDVHKPKLWCYNHLQFLERHTTPRRSASNFIPLEQEKEITSDIQIDDLLLQNFAEEGLSERISVPLLSGESACTSIAQVSTSNTSSKSGSSKGTPTPKRKRTEEANDVHDFLSKASSALNNSMQKYSTMETFGLYVGRELTEISDKRRQKAAVKKIFEILMDAKDEEDS